MVCLEFRNFVLCSFLRKSFILFCVWASLWGASYAQSPYVTFHGSLSLSDEFYSASGIEARRPGNQSRGMLNANLVLFDQIQLPFQFYFTTNQTQFQQPFNQFGLNPRITKWLTLHGGYFSARISDLSFGDLRLYGGGIELTPGNFRLKILYGRTKNAVSSDSLRNMPGTYKQTAFAAQLGYGNESESFINVNMSHVYDDTTSLNQDAVTPKPAENLVISNQFGIRFSRYFSMKGELGISAYTNDLHSDKVEDMVNRVPAFFFTPRISSQIDGAGIMALNITPSEYWSLGLNGKWIGPGYISSGYAQMPNDIMEFTANPSVRLFGSKLNIATGVGFRTNNLRDNKLNTTKGFTGMASVDYQMNSLFGVNFLYNDNEVKSDNRSNLSKVSNIFNMFTLSPRFMFQGMGGANSVIVTYSYQDSQDKNMFLQQNSDTTSGVDPVLAILQQSRNQTRSFMAVHSLSLPTSLSFSTSFFYTNTTIPNASIKIININENLSRQFLENRLGLTLGLGYSSTHYVSTNGQFIASFNASYSLEKYGSVNFMLSNNRYKGNSETPGYSELQGSLQYTINL